MEIIYIQRADEFSLFKTDYCIYYFIDLKEKKLYKNTNNLVANK